MTVNFRIYNFVSNELFRRIVPLTERCPHHGYLITLTCCFGSCVLWIVETSTVIQRSNVFELVASSNRSVKSIKVKKGSRCADDGPLPRHGTEVGFSKKLEFAGSVTRIMTFVDAADWVSSSKNKTQKRQWPCGWRSSGDAVKLKFRCQRNWNLQCMVHCLFHRVDGDWLHCLSYDDGGNHDSWSMTPISSSTLS